MAQVINTNIASLNAQRNLNNSQNAINTSLQRLSTGLRINSAKDDAAGLAISQRMTTQINGLDQATRNANDGISLAQTAEGALSQVSDNLQRIRELAVQAGNATNSDDDRAALQKEASQLMSEITRVAQSTDFNGTKLLDGSFKNESFQIGANQGQTITIGSILNTNVNKLGSWTSAATASTITGALPTGSGGAATPTPGSTTVTSEGFGTAATSFTLTNTTAATPAVTVNVAAVTGATDSAAALTQLQANINQGLTAAGITDVTATVAADGTVSLANASATDAYQVNNAADLNIADATAITASGSTTGTAPVDAPTQTFGIAALTAGQFTVNGKDITVAAVTGAASADDAMTAYAAALTTAIHGSVTDNSLDDVTVSYDTTAKTLKFDNQTTADVAVAGSAAPVASGTVAAGDNVTGGIGATTPPATGGATSKPTFAAIGAGALNINGVDITVRSASSAADRASSLADAINGQSSTTGVTASLDEDGKLVLTSTTGDITVKSNDAAGLTAATGLTIGTTAAGSTDTNAPSYATGGTTGNTSYQAGTAQIGFAGLDISTVDGANNAMLAMDGALNSVNQARANLGAIQNRFSSVVSNLQTTSENLSDARSRIQDTDFASETASLTQAQILQQAGTAMLAQANSLPNTVLTLLRGG